MSEVISRTLNGKIHVYRAGGLVPRIRMSPLGERATEAIEKYLEDFDGQEVQITIGPIPKEE